MKHLNTGQTKPPITSYWLEPKGQESTSHMTTLVRTGPNQINQTYLNNFWLCLYPAVIIMQNSLILNWGKTPHNLRLNKRLNLKITLLQFFVVLSSVVVDQIYSKSILPSNLKPDSTCFLSPPAQPTELL